jgi:cation diffusion facilitator family transporter
MFSLGLMWLGERIFVGTHFHWLDPIAALIVAVLILHAAYDLTRSSARDLLDWSLPEEEEQWIRDYLDSLQPDVCDFHRLRTRKSGSRRFMDVHLLVDPNLTVRKAHDIAEEVEHHIEAHLPNCSVVIHVEPCEAE